MHVWNALGFGVANQRCRFEDWAQAAEQALRHARLAGQRSSRLFCLESALALGPRPADEALRTLDALLPENPHPLPLLTRAWLLTMLARFEEASQVAREAGERWRELTGDDEVDWILALVAATAGDHEAAAEHLRRFCELVEARGQRGFLSTFAPMLGRSLCALGRHDEAEPLAQLGRELGDEQDGVGAGTLAAGAGARSRPPRRARRGGAARPRGRRDHGAHGRVELARRRALRPRRGAARRRPH